mmetsp:Transcript_12963/g.36349  ORF Transcript_12963/g.36349 Transcript_12963/m.36349 type:complete len:114 (-) Transcript_12963:2345-2686(-)
MVAGIRVATPRGVGGCLGVPGSRAAITRRKWTVASTRSSSSESSSSSSSSSKKSSEKQRAPPDGEYFRGMITSPLKEEDLERDMVTPTLKFVTRAGVVLVLLVLGFMKSNNLL